MLPLLSSNGSRRVLRNRQARRALRRCEERSAHAVPGREHAVRPRRSVLEDAMSLVFNITHATRRRVIAAGAGCSFVDAFGFLRAEPQAAEARARRQERSRAGLRARQHLVLGHHLPTGPVERISHLVVTRTRRRRLWEAASPAKRSNQHDTQCVFAAVALTFCFHHGHAECQTMKRTCRISQC